MITTVSVPVNPTLKRWGLQHLPDDYYDNPELCAFLLYCHGIGEVGTGIEHVNSLYQHGPLGFAKNGDPFIFADITTGKKYRFILLAVQHDSFSLPASEIKYVIENYVFPNFKVDKSAVFVTGLSAGGDSTLKAITSPGVLELISAAVPMSPASSGLTTNLTHTSAAGIRVWGITGDTDGSYTTNAKWFDESYKKIKPDGSTLYLYPGGHGGWSAYYDPAFRGRFNNNVDLNIYEWMLANRKGSVGVGQFKPIPPVPLYANAGADTSINTSTFKLDASKSTGFNPYTSGWETLEKPPGATWDIYPNFNKTGAVINLKNLVTGKYVFEFTARDNNNNVMKDAVTVQVDLQGTTTKAVTTAAPTTTRTSTTNTTTQASQFLFSLLVEGVTYAGYKTGNAYELKVS